LGLLWFDGEWERAWTHAHAQDLDAYLRHLQPSLIINNRIDKGRRDMEGTTATGDFLGDYDTPEQQIGKFQTARPWESCITICQQWAWKPNDKMKSLEECLRTLITCAGGDGNLLLNVGPMPNGEIEPRQATRLREMGQWLDKNGRSIIGTRGGPFKPGSWGASTHRDKTVYVHVFNWPSGGLKLPLAGKKIVACKTLAGASVEWRQDQQTATLQVAPADRQPIVTVIDVQLDAPVDDITPTGLQ
jgi:alpha-L-fucosidase